MYLSKLKLNPKNVRVIKELINPYELHKTLLTAFPDKEDGGPGRVLFRVDTNPLDGTPEILIQSTKAPDWATFNVDQRYLADVIECKEFDPIFHQGQALIFRLVANPTKKIMRKRLGLISEEDQISWLSRKGENGGFTPLQVRMINKGLHKNKRPDGAMSFLGIQFDGLLRVTDPVTFRKVLEQGVGSGKGFGFGLLSLAPA